MNSSTWLRRKPDQLKRDEVANIRIRNYSEWGRLLSGRNDEISIKERKAIGRIRSFMSSCGKETKI